MTLRKLTRPKALVSIGMEDERGRLLHGQHQRVPDMGTVAVVAILVEGEDNALWVAFAENPALKNRSVIPMMIVLLLVIRNSNV